MRHARAGLSRWPMLALLGWTACSLLGAEDAGRERISIAKTETTDFPAGGTLRLKNAIGELTIEGWDQPSLEITTIKSSKDAVEAKDRETVTKRLDAVKVTTQKKGDEVTVSSEYPKYSKLKRPFRGLTDFALEYRIKVPRTARLVVEESVGETHIDNVRGDIQVAEHMGEITVRVPDGQYAIDARSKAGAVESDFPGQDQRKKLLGHAFIATPAAAAQKIFLRIGYGDIVILKHTDR